MKDLSVLLVSSCLAVVSLAEKSEQLQCGPHEVTSCVHPCPPERTCRNRGIAFSCLYDDKPCTPKCVCEDGFFRNSIGECITGEQCDKCQAPNEFYSCNSACDNVCEHIATQNRTQCPILNVKCNEWCYCDDGFARDGYGNCVPVSQCSASEPVRSPPLGRYDKKDTPCTGPNEVFTCKTSCPPETCHSLAARYKCDSREICQMRCACEHGYLRVADGTPCIPISNCPSMTDSPDYTNK